MTAPKLVRAHGDNNSQVSVETLPFLPCLDACIPVSFSRLGTRHGWQLRRFAGDLSRHLSPHLQVHELSRYHAEWTLPRPESYK